MSFNILASLHLHLDLPALLRQDKWTITSDIQTVLQPSRNHLIRSLTTTIYQLPEQAIPTPNNSILLSANGSSTDKTPYPVKIQDYNILHLTT